MTKSAPSPTGQSTVITGAEPSYDEQFRSRRKRYVIMMALRLPCLVAAALLYHTPWLAVLIIAVSIPLPWMAVLIANDGPAKKTQRRPDRVFHEQPELTGPAHEIIESAGGDGEPGVEQTEGRAAGSDEQESR